MNILDALRAGRRPSLTDKALTCDSVEELDGFVAELSARGRVLTEDERNEIAHHRIRLTSSSQRRASSA